MPPKITVLGTGGTIAGSGTYAGQTAGYKSGVLSVDGLIKAVPELGKVAKLRSRQIANVGSPDMTAEDLVRMAQTIERELQGDTQGVVVTHGTDTLEESAFFLELTINSDKPVVLVGAMRPATAYSADGPMNLLCAVNLAASPSARKRGVMIALNDRICSARFTTKTNANSLDSFRAVEQGYLGMFVNTQPIFYYPPCRPLNRSYFNVADRNPRDGLPQVDILYGHLDMNPALLKTAAETSQGVVLAAMGGGCWATGAGRRVAELVRARDYPVVVSRRMASGFVGGTSNYGLEDCCIGGGLLDANRCRIQLQLALASGLDRKAIRDVFESHGAERAAAGLEARIRRTSVL
ncbi:L-asparaginase 2-2 [Hirsutella rhossiliensis]|uniref:asparaginase n=1 Tax=Hirsutella rhossiliensis TaxID=111463 RepID=A0A9P8N5V7_9HYPO|nr:L-asparaginase 2-2 [Hirsutella rhossiliensis]KAH0967162.1 L-asparaginase 2-2 [Hirsutella rhossiliensis]